MTLLERWERRLEALVEGLVHRAGSGRVQPLEIARQLVRAMDRHQTVSVMRVYVPNAFAVRLSPSAFEELSRIAPALEEELAGYLRQHAEERGYTLVGPVTVCLLPDETVSLREIRVEARAVPVREGGDTHDTRVYRARRGEGALVVVQGVQQGMRFPLEGEVVTVGRRRTCDVVIPDPCVSREHLRVEREEGGWRVVDLGSTNGTFVNERKVAVHRLRAGDRIRIGNTVLEYEQG